VIVLSAMPVIGFEMKNIQLIAGELDKLAQTLRDYPTSGEDMGIARSARSSAPSQAILRSLQKINASLAEGARRESLSSTAFTELGRGFEEIGTTLQGVASASKTTAKKTIKKATRR
jgi:hypothetical protein